MRPKTGCLFVLHVFIPILGEDNFNSKLGEYTNMTE